MADSILKIRTQDGDKPIGYPGLADKPVANKTLDTEGAFADAKVVGDKFKEVKAETDSLKEDIGDIYSDGVAPDTIDAEMVDFIKTSNPNIAIPTKQTLAVVTKQGSIANVSISFDGTVTVDNPDGAVNNVYLQIPTKANMVYSVISKLNNYDVTKVIICKSDKTAVASLKSESQTITTNSDTENMLIRFDAIGKTTFAFKLIVRLNSKEAKGLLDKSKIDLSVETTDLSSDFILPVDKTENMQLIGNLFDKNNVIKGAYNYYGTIKEDDDFYYSNLIPIKENQGYTLTKPRFVSIVDKNGVYRKANSDSNPNQFLTKAGDRYVVLSAKISSELELAGLFEGYFNAAKPRNYKPFSVLYKGTLVQNGWYGKRIATLGDSITEMNKWQPYVKNALGCEILNYGIGGTKVAIKADAADYDNTHSMCTDTRINAIDANADCVIFMGGTNDRGQSIPIGTIDDSGTDTFYGALNTMTNKLLARFPTTRIIYMTCVYSHAQPGASFSIIDYNNAIKSIAEKYHIPCIDVGGCCGWNELNYSNYLSDGRHPAGATGARRMSEIIISSLNGLQPIDYAFEGLD